MSVLKSLRKLLKKFDLFSNSQFLRFQQEGQYKTASGGICSLVVIVVFMTLFMSTAIQTVNMQIINWTSTSELQFDPSETIVSVDPPANPFMFAVKMMGVNLNDNFRFFDISIVERNFINGVYENTPKFTDLVACTTQHFGLTAEIKKFAMTTDYQNWLCPPLGFSFSLKGKYLSADMKFLEIRIKQCDNSKDPTRPCVSNGTLDFYEQAFEQFVVGLLLINPLLNPGDQNYLSYYLQDQNYVRFTRKLGSDSNGKIEDFTIETDVSLLPFTQNVVDKGVIIPEIFQNIAFEVTNNRYASFFFMKSSRSTSYSRSFNKLDTFFSYVGGLVGTILGLMFVVASFTSMAYQLQLAERVCRYTEDIRNDFSSFSLLSYAIFVFYGIGKMCGFGKKWENMQQLQACSEELARQLDVQLLLQRLLFLERATQTLLEQHQIHGLHLHRLDTLKEIKKRRKRYSLRQSEQGNDSQQSQECQNNSTVSMDPNMNTSKAQNLAFQEPSLIKDSKSPKRKMLPPLDRRNLVIKQLLQQSLKGNRISKKILQGIQETKTDVSLLGMNKLLHQSSQVIHLKPNDSMQFQFDT